MACDGGHFGFPIDKTKIKIKQNKLLSRSNKEHSYHLIIPSHM
jgi:hypothetical protein